jgi:uncharacterized membrane protein (UPF0182 family)
MSDQAATALPELKRVIVSFGDHLVMGENLESAIYGVLGEAVPTAESVSTAIAPALPGTVNSEVSEALEHFEKAKAYSREGNWAGYGTELEALEKILNQMAAETSKTSKKP